MQVSEVFIDVMSEKDKVPVAKCRHCGRTHFDCTGFNIGHNQFAELQEKAETNPDKYLAHDGPIAVVDLVGLLAVSDCSCDIVAAFEGFLQRKKSDILSYYKNKEEFDSDPSNKPLIEDEDFQGVYGVIPIS